MPRAIFAFSLLPLLACSTAEEPRTSPPSVVAASPAQPPKASEAPLAGPEHALGFLEASEGTHYVKLTGPAATIARWQTSYLGFIDATR